MMEYYNKASEEIVNNIVAMQTEHYQKTIDLVNSLIIPEADKNLLIYRIDRIYDWRERYELENDDDEQ